ncbi:hypothetical protein BDZ85DRAFT_285447 [Elsinoe ampelina]|uniref:Ribonucleases P/MRP subunit Pop8-like domain-containing protein n=1 Tax=Elsinoe ampelina TaxID=302913 RepID=A0A6A6G0M8_9PEZI|nr:hypothetical protein BDZ85DRAFT_285447 [Elsinoe ampelina]
MSTENLDNGGRSPVDLKKETANDAASKKRKSKPDKNPVISQFTIRNPDWSYIHLKLITPASLQAAVEGSNKTTRLSLDEVTAYLHLQSALQRYLGIHGTAIPLDILKVEGPEVWVRAPRDDASAVVAAAGGWVGNGGEGWRVVAWGCWGPNDGNDGKDLFG